MARHLRGFTFPLLLPVIVSAILGLIVPSAYGAITAAVPAEPEMDPPTLKCLGVKWIIRGDTNEDARVFVNYRKRGGKWRRGMDLFRVETEAIPESERPAPDEHLFAGSVFDLEENAEYELRLRLIDPDGGSVTQKLQARTKTCPRSYSKGRVLHVSPGNGGGSGSTNDPFLGLDAADAAAQPGDTFLLAPGTYAGTWTVKTDGTREKPITWRGTPGGKSVLDGKKGTGKLSSRVLSAGDRHDLIFENLTVCNGEFISVFHRAKRITIRRCRFYGGPYAIVAHVQTEGKTIEDFLIEDNVLEGPSTWPRTKGIENARGIQLSGTGSTVRFNRIMGFADGIDTFHSLPCAAIDIYGNEISEMTDDGIETDYSIRNVRCFDNRLTNVFQGISAQPVYGGPVYIFRNAMLNLEGSVFKLHNGPSGVLMLHNTSVKAGMPFVLYPKARVGNCVSRNNLYIGTLAEYAYETTAKMENCDFDYDGFGGGPWTLFLKWNEVRYANIEEAREKAPVYRNVSFVDPAGCFASGLLPPGDPRAQAFGTETNDLRLAADSKARDRGAVIPGLNDGYEGEAPDLGAFEFGSALPHYGPRQE
jgi:hypothetical protein